MNPVFLVNTRSPIPVNANDFELKSSLPARDREAARDELSLEENYAPRRADAPFESGPARDEDEQDHANGELAALAQASEEDAFAHPLEFVEEPELDDLEIHDIADSHSENLTDARPQRDGERDGAEDYAEFERVFVQWKATGDPRLRERLILMNRSMVMFLARRFMDRGELFEDVLQVGMLGLIYALDGYELERGIKFSTFAIPTISGEIRRYFRDKVSGMRVPRGLQELHSQLQTRIEELTQQLDRSPTYAEIAFSLKIEVEQVVEAMELGSAIDPLSIDDRFYGEESATIAESIGAPDPQLRAYEEHAALQSALEKLPAQERRVLEMNFFEGHSQAEIARRLHVSQMHISRLLRRSLAQLKELLQDS